MISVFQMFSQELERRPQIGNWDFVHIDENIFPPGFLGICLDNYSNRPITMCDVYTLFPEMGSVYASDLSRLNVNREEFRKYLGALHESIKEVTGHPPDWKPEDLDKNQFLKPSGV